MIITVVGGDKMRTLIFPAYDLNAMFKHSVCRTTLAPKDNRTADEKTKLVY
jgi:hypothetical protein